MAQRRLRRRGTATPLTEGGRNWGVIASLIETAKLNDIDPQAYLAGTLIALVNGHKQSRIEELMPWRYTA